MPRRAVPVLVGMALLLALAGSAGGGRTVVKLAFERPTFEEELATAIAEAERVLNRPQCVAAFKKYARTTAAKVTGRGLVLVVQWPDAASWLARASCPNRVVLNGTLMMQYGGELVGRLVIPHELAHLAACDIHKSSAQDEALAQVIETECAAVPEFDKGFTQ